jgi:uncharacterized protein (DUF697 family)
MNKKNLPKAIRPSGVDTGGADPMRDATGPATTAPARTSMVTTETTSPDATEMSPERRRAIAEKLVERFSLWGGAAGLIPVPFVDLATVGGVQIQMLRRISKIYNVPFSANRGKALIAALAGAMIPAGSGLGAASLSKSVPIAGAVVSALAMPTLSAGATYAIGMAFIEHFASGGTLLDFNPPDYRDFIKTQKRKRSSRSTASHV